MKSTYIIYYEAYAYGKVVSNGNFEYTALNPGEGFLEEAQNELSKSVKEVQKNAENVIIKHICKL